MKQEREQQKFMSNEQRLDAKYAADEARKDALQRIKEGIESSKGHQTLAHKQEIHNDKIGAPLARNASSHYRDISVPQMPQVPQNQSMPMMPPGRDAYTGGPISPTDNKLVRVNDKEAIIPAESSMNPKYQPIISEMVAAGRKGVPRQTGAPDMPVMGYQSGRDPAEEQRLREAQKAVPPPQNFPQRVMSGIESFAGVQNLR